VEVPVSGEPRPNEDCGFAVSRDVLKTLFSDTFVIESDAAMADTTHEESSALTDVIAQKADTWKYPLLALLVIVIAIAAIVSYSRKSAARADAAARDRVFETLAGVQNGSRQASEAAAVFAQEAKDYRGMSAGAQASLYEFAYLYNENKDYAVAEQAAGQFVREYPRSSMAPRARFAQAQAMFQQGKLDDAVAAFRALVASNDPELFPEAKLALAQALERRAEEVKDNPDEYRARLEEAEAEYTDIVTRAQISVPAQRGFWPQAVTLPADYALVQLKDRLAGNVHAKPLGVAAAQAVRDGEVSIPPPPADSAAAPAVPVLPVPASANEAGDKPAAPAPGAEATPEKTPEDKTE
jgi:TolA-binding protein